MASSRRRSDWTETLLYAGIFILLAVFIYQLLKLLNQGAQSISDVGSSLGQAIGNTVAGVEDFLTGLATAPLSALNSLFSFLPDFIEQILTFFTSTIFSILSGGASAGLTSIFSGTASALNAGQGSSYIGTTPSPTLINNSSTFSAAGS